ncbi:MAG: pirin family protein [Bryobacteraceae bacterium]|nr:pirin family protein [Bryobacteraceae bacterium]
MLKQVTGIHPAGSSHWVGDGFPVRNLFPSNGIEQQVNPFLMLDYAGPREFPPSTKQPGVGEHPHRGFETVTIVYQGHLEHRDSSGSAGSIGPGDVQWMTAASGVVHEELFEKDFARRGGTLEMVQLWVNLPRADKMSPPGYQTLTAGIIPSYGPARVIAGEIDGVRGPARTFTPVHLFDIRLKAGETAAIPVPAGHNSALVLLKGGVRVDSTLVEGEALLALLSQSGGAVHLSAEKDSTLLILGGQPIEEPVASYGPFVMNTQEEIRQAIEDYRAGRMGRLPARR